LHNPKLNIKIFEKKKKNSILKIKNEFLIHKRIPHRADEANNKTVSVQLNHDQLTRLRFQPPLLFDLQHEQVQQKKALLLSQSVRAELIARKQPPIFHVPSRHTPNNASNQHIRVYSFQELRLFAHCDDVLFFFRGFRLVYPNGKVLAFFFKAQSLISTLA
jgi:hypothetical protein